MSTLRLKNKYKFSNHHLEERRYIDVKLMVMSLNALRILKHDEKYDITNTQCKSTTTLNELVISYYKKEGVCTDPIVVTDDDFCLDGRHRVTYRKHINDTICSAYIVPRKYINRFIKTY